MIIPQTKIQVYNSNQDRSGQLLDALTFQSQLHSYRNPCQDIYSVKRWFREVPHIVAGSHEQAAEDNKINHYSDIT